MKDRNANKPGYKKTKAGWIPKEWECVPAGTLFDIQLGKMLNQKARNGNNPQPYLANCNVRWGEFDLSEVQKMSFYEKELYKFELQQGDLLVCEGGEVGRCAVWDEQIKPCYYQKALHRVRPSGEKTDVYFIMYFLHHIAATPMMVHYVSQTSISHFTREQFLNFPIALPSLPEQKKIVKILSTWDAVIDQTRKLIFAKKNRKKALMQQLLGPKGQWTECYLKDVANINSRSLPESTDPDFQFVYIDIASANDGKIQENGKLIQFSTAPSRARRLFSEGDIIMSTVRPNLKNYVYVDFSCSQYVCSTGFAVIAPKKNIFGPFLYQLLYSDNIQRQCYACVAGSNYPAMSQRDVEMIKLCMPGIREQKKIAGVFSSADKEIESLKNKKITLEKQKRGLMQKLLTGEIRVET